MPDERGIGILNGLEQAVGHLRGTLVEVRVHAGDDQIHLFEHGVGEIERAVGKNVDFDSGEDSDSVDLFIRGANTFDVLDGALCRRVRWRMPGSWSGR